MDITSYLLGKNSSGGSGGGGDEYFETDLSSITNLSAPVTKCVKKIPALTINSSITYTSNWFANCSALETAPQINTENITDMGGMFSYCTSLKNVPSYNLSKVTNLSYMFDHCSALETAPTFNTSNVESFAQMFTTCSNLQNVPKYDFSSVKTSQHLANMFRACTKLTDESLDNILQMCISATSFTGTKSLTSLGISSSYYSASRVQALPHYQDFVSAGWSTGF